MDIDEADSPPDGGSYGVSDSIGYVMVLEIEKNPRTRATDFANDSGAGRCKELASDLVVVH
jgi:hypothetical protein